MCLPHVSSIFKIISPKILDRNVYGRKTRSDGSELADSTVISPQINDEAITIILLDVPLPNSGLACHST